MRAVGRNIRRDRVANILNELRGEGPSTRGQLRGCAFGCALEQRRQVEVKEAHRARLFLEPLAPQAA